VARDRASSTRVVHPLGLVSKGPSWYLVAGTDAGLRTFRVDRVTSVEGAGAPVVRPEGFELSEAWRLIADDVDRRRTPLTVLAAAAPEHLPLLHMVLRGGWARCAPCRRAGGARDPRARRRGHRR
jgi:predicted DNA-binding transcriptional regulator YafY